MPALLELAAQTGAAGRQGSEDRPDAGSRRSSRPASRRGCSASRAGIRPTSSATATAKCSTIRSRSRRRKRARSRSSTTSSSRTSIPTSTRSSLHVVRINYYPPRGDNKEGWDNIDIFGWLGYPMQLKINFLCRDSILAAPIVLDRRAVPRPGEARGDVRHPGVALVLLQEPDARARTVPGARSLHSADEAEEHAALHARRGAHHAPRPGVLRLMDQAERSRPPRRCLHRRAVGAADRQHGQLLLLPVGGRAAVSPRLSEAAESAADHAADERSSACSPASSAASIGDPVDPDRCVMWRRAAAMDQRDSIAATPLAA